MPAHRRKRVFFTPEIGEAILDRIGAGEPLVHVCGPGRQAGMPDRQTVYQWLRRDEGFLGRYMAAKQLGALALCEEIVEIADGREVEDRPGYRHRSSFGRQAAGELPVTLPAEMRNLGRDWLRVTARRWLAGMMAPKAWGTEMGSVRGAWQVEREANAEMTEDEMAAKIAAILASVQARREEREAAAAAALEHQPITRTDASPGGD